MHVSRRTGGQSRCRSERCFAAVVSAAAVAVQCRHQSSCGQHGAVPWAVASDRDLP